MPGIRACLTPTALQSCAHGGPTAERRRYARCRYEWAFWGTGPHATNSVLPAFRAQGWEVGALCSVDADLPDQASRLGIPVATADYRALVERDDLDAVAIVTPTPTHREIMLAAAAAGKHVLCEKPIAMNLQDARDMHAAAEAAGVTAMIDFEFRFTPTRLHVQQLLADGYVGELRHATIELMIESQFLGPDFSWHDQAALGGGTLNEHGSHYIDMVRQWVRGDPRRQRPSAHVQGRSPRPRERGDRPGRHR